MSESAGAARTGHGGVLWTGRAGLAVLFVLGVVACVGSLVSLDQGTAAEPGPGLWITCISAAGAAFGAVCLFIPSVTRDEVETISRPELGVLGLAAPALVLTLPMLSLLGVTLTVLMLSFYWFKVPLQASWRRSAISAAAITASIYTIFVLLLQVPFPAGSLTGL